MSGRIPPLGKTLMMIGIELFGMTPFGWRFMGALMGVLMLPVMYLLVKQLTKRTDLSCIAMFLLAVDAMHFTQTRIATIDSYVVLFIMVMYLFMFRYSQMRWRRDGFARSLVPLGAVRPVHWASPGRRSGVGIYGSAGLVVIFFWTLWKNVREELRRVESASRRAKDAPHPSRAARGEPGAFREAGRASYGARTARRNRSRYASARPSRVERRKAAKRGLACRPPRPLGVALFISLWAGMLLALVSCAAIVLDGFPGCWRSPHR